MFSPSWRPIREPPVAWVSAATDLFPMEEGVNELRMEGVRLEATFARNPCIHAGFSEPCRWLQCGFGPLKVNGKRLFSTILLGFCA
jgi:hypothetical protein